jgi:hypothetical protein
MGNGIGMTHYDHLRGRLLHEIMPHSESRAKRLDRLGTGIPASSFLVGKGYDG